MLRRDCRRLRTEARTPVKKLLQSFRQAMRAACVR